MRIALVEPTYAPRGVRIGLAYEPHGLLMLAAALRRDAMVPKVFRVHANTLEADVDRILSWKPAAVGVSVYTHGFPTGRHFACALKSRGFRGPIVFGGSHATAAPQIALQPGVDWVLRGEGEIAGVALFRALICGGDPTDVSGVAFQRNGALIQPKPFELVESLSSLPWADRTQLPPELELTPGAYGLPKAVVLTSRGCTSACSFCLAPLLSRRRVRLRDPNDVADECLALRDRHGVRFIYFGDDEFFAGAAHVEAVCAALVARKVNVPFFCMGKIDLLDAPMLRRLRQAGCHRIFVGLERPPGRSPWTNKARNASAVHRTLELAREHGILTQAGFIIGFPDDDVDSLSALAQCVRQLPADYLGVTIVTPFVGTTLRPRMAALGVEVYDDAERFSYDRVAFAHPRLSEPELLEWRHRILRTFYLGRGRVTRAVRELWARPTLIGDYTRLLVTAVQDGLLR